MLWAVIMAGGSGTRFWPESRALRPKQLLQIFGKKTLLEQTVDRIRPLIPKERILIVTNQSYAGLIQRIVKLPAKQIIGEPVGRNTAPCAVLAAQMAFRKDPKAVLAILPSDHRIAKEGEFRKALKAAAGIATEGELPVTFGIRPHYPHTGFGYLELGQKMKSKTSFSAYRLKRFCEKPNLKKAKMFLRSKRYLWNSGMFVWKADSLLEAARNHQPKIIKLAEKIASKFSRAAIKRVFPQMPDVSIDFGLMEYLKGKIIAIPIDIGWNDLGGWQVVSEIWPQDSQGNIICGKPILINSQNSIVRAGKRLIALVGMSDCVIVDSDDALLICHRHQTEAVRHVVQELKKRKKRELL